MGELSALFAALLRQFFLGTHDMAKAGIDLLLHDGTSMKVFVEFGAMLADEAALHSAYQCRGASGLKPCALCSNIFNWKVPRDVVLHDPSGTARYHTCFDVDAIKLHTTGTLRAVAQRLAAASAVMTAANLEELQTRLGFNYVPKGVLQDAELRALCNPVSHLLFDTMHVYYVNGIFNNHVGRLIESVKPYGLTYQQLHDYASCWTWPARVKGNTGTDAFAGKRAESSWKAGVFKCTASEALCLMPVISRFVEAVVLTSSLAAGRHAACFLLLAKVLELLEQTPRGGVTPQELQRAIVAHLNAYKMLYGEEWMPIKFHLSMHFPTFLGRWGILPNCFVLERKHKRPKVFANEIQNTSFNWERSTLREVTVNHFADLERKGHFQAAACLVDPYTPRATTMLKIRDEMGIGADFVVMTARKARINEFEIVSNGDVVLVQPAEAANNRFAGQVKYFVALEDPAGESEVFVQIERWTLIAEGSRCSKWRRSVNDLVFISAAEIVCSVIWARSGNTASVLKCIKL